MSDSYERLVRALMGARVNAEGGGGGMGNGLFSGGGRVRADIPLNDYLTVAPYMGGGGAFGTVNDGGRKIKVREFSPEFGAQLNYRW